MSNRKYQIIIIVFLLLTVTVFGQKARIDYLLAFSESSSGQELWGFKTISGRVAIQPIYENILGADTLYHFGFVTLNYKWIAINIKNDIILTPYIFDNGPDYFEEGVFRFVENNKIGFANSKGQKVIPAQFDFASPFSGGLAAFSVGGKMEKGDEEHSTWSGGTWGFINKKGQVVIKPQFAKTYDFDGATCEVWTKENKHVLIDNKGHIIKVLTN